MNETSPAPVQPLEAPSINPNQEQLFDDKQFGPEHQAALEAREERINDIYSGIDTTAADQKVRLNEPLSAETAQDTKDALGHLQDPNAEVPESLQVKRDWSDSAAAHDEKQAAYTAEAAKVLEAQLAAHDKVAASRERAAAKQQEKIDLREAVEARDAHTAKLKEQMNSDAAEREAIRQEFIDSERFKLGEIAFNNPINREDVEERASRHVSQHFLDQVETLDVEPGQGTALDVDNLKAEHAEQQANGIKTPAEENREANRRAAEEFQKSFTDPAERKEADESVGNDVYYEADENGQVQTAVEIAVDYDGVDPNTLPDGKIYVTAGNTAFYIDMTTREITDLVSLGMNVRGEADQDDMWDFDQDEVMPLIIVGEPLIIDGKAVSDPIKRIEIKQQKVDSDGLDKDVDWQQRGEDPFVMAEKLIAESEAQTIEMPAIEPQEEPEVRRKGVMGWASRQLDRLRLTSGNAILGASESRGRKTIAAAVLGTLAASYVSYKLGLDISHHSTEAHAHGRDLLSGANTAPAAPVAPEHASASGAAVDVALPGKTGAGEVVKDHVRTVIERDGQNPWLISEHQEQIRGIADPTNAQIEAFDKRMAELNPNIYSYGGTSSEYIPAGTRLVVPQ